MDNQVEEKKFWNVELETLSREELFEEVEKSLLFSQLNYVLKNSRFYINKYGGIGLTASALSPRIDFGSLPFTEKSEIIEDQKEYPPFGRILAVPFENLKRVHRTSGSSGRPVFVALTQNDIKQTLEAGARSFWCAGVRPKDLIIHCLNYCLWMGGLTDHLCLEKTGATVVPYGVGNSRYLLETIGYLSPTTISCTPSYMSKLEVILRDELKINPRSLGLKRGLFGGEPGIQNPKMRKAIEKKWGIEAIDANYGMADILSIFGAECEHRGGLHFNGQGILYVELINPATGENLDFKENEIGEFVYTNLRREGQPLIRYRSHDLVEITGVGPCDCGRGGFRFKILGRSDDMLIVKGINVFPNAIGEVVSKFLGPLTGEFEVVLEKPPPYDFLKIRVEHRRSESESSLKIAKESLRRAFRELLEFKAKIEMVSEGEVTRTEGKTRRVKKVY